MGGEHPTADKYKQKCPIPQLSSDRENAMVRAPGGKTLAGRQEGQVGKIFYRKHWSNLNYRDSQPYLHLKNQLIKGNLGPD